MFTYLIIPSDPRFHSFSHDQILQLVKIHRLSDHYSALEYHRLEEDLRT